MTKSKLWKKIGAVLMTAALSVGIVVSPVGSMEAKAANEAIYLQATPTNGGAQVTWEYENIDDNVAVHVYYGEGDNEGQFALISAKGCTFSGLTNGREYTIGINTLESCPQIPAANQSYTADPSQARTTIENGNLIGNSTKVTPGASAGGSSAATSKPAPHKSAFERTTDNYSKGIKEAKTGSSVKIKGDASFNALPNSIMKDLLKKKDVDLEFSYEYKGMSYTIRIPAGSAEDNDIPWYGPMYLWGKYGVSSSPVVAAK